MSTRICGICFHLATEDKLCSTCESDRKLSERVWHYQKIDKEYYNLVADPSTQQGYINEFFARIEHDKQNSVEVLRRVTLNICNKLGCDPKHWRD